MYRDNSPALGNTAQENSPDSQVLVASIQPGQAIFKSHVMMPRTTITNRLKILSENNLIIKKSFGNIRCYSLNLDIVDELSSK